MVALLLAVGEERTFDGIDEENQTDIAPRGDGRSRRRSLAGLLRGQQRCHFQRRENGAAQTRHGRDQGHRRGRLHLRPADRDELRRDVRVRRGPQLGPVQGALQSDQERSPCLHLQRHGHHHAEQRHAVFFRLAGSARRADRAVGPGGGETRYYSVHALRRQHLQLRLHRHPRHRQRGRRLHGGRAGLEGRDPAGHQEGVPVEHAVLVGGIPHPALQSRPTCPTWSRCRPATRCSRSRPIFKQPAPPAAPAIDFPKIDKELVKTNFFEYLDFALQFAPAGPEEKEIRAKLARIGIGPGKTFDFKDLSPEAQSRSCGWA